MGKVKVEVYGMTLEKEMSDKYCYKVFWELVPKAKEESQPPQQTYPRSVR